MNNNNNGGGASSPKPSPKDVFPLLALELRRVKWLDPKTMDLVFRKCPHLGVTRGAIVTALRVRRYDSKRSMRGFIN